MSDQVAPAAADAVRGEGNTASFWKGVSLGFLPIVAGLLVYSVTAGASSAVPNSDAVKKALAERLPRTKVDRVDCSVVPGICEVAAGQTLFYTDARARFLMVGRVYDMETRADVTAARLLELNPDLLLAGAPKNETAGPAAGAQPHREAIAQVDLSALPATGAVHWGPKGGTKVTLFSDFRCHYCKQMVGDLKALGLRVEERPISVLGSRKLSEAVYCAIDPAKAAEAAYAGDDKPQPQRANCNPSDLNANEEFARRNGFTGTPVLVRSDGTVLVGYRPAAQLSAWLKAGAPPASRG